jgi:phospholipase C
VGGLLESRFTRRRFVAGAAGLALSSASATALGRIAQAGAASSLPAPASSGIDHVVVVMMENRSFDHFLGWLPGADGKTSGLTYPGRDGTTRSTYHLADFQGCAHPDPDHSYEGGRAELDDGRADGWLQAGDNDVYAIGYYERDDLPFFGEAAAAWTACDRYFSPILGPTYPNRFYAHAGTTDRIVNTTSTSTLPTIWDRLAAAGLKGTYYFSDIPFLALWGTKYARISSRYEQFLADCAAGRLPQVAYVDPRFGGEDQGTSNDDHPHADIRAGESLLNQVYEAVTSGPNWASTLLVITFDEWGGFFDHVAPTLAPDVQPAFERRGFRVPTLLISPFAARQSVAHDVYDHASILRLIEWRWNLQPLSTRDARATNLAQALDFGNTRADAPRFRVPPAATAACTPLGATPVGEHEWSELAVLARTYGFPV